MYSSSKYQTIRSPGLIQFSLKMQKYDTNIQQSPCMPLKFRLKIQTLNAPNDNLELVLDFRK